ncbi:MAG: hypothetical protein AB7K52_11865 [Phycisphaerales bacterium]
MNRRTLALISSAGALTLALALPVLGGGGNDYRVRARMSGTGTLASGKADYRERNRGGAIQQRFNVEIEDATPDTTYEVRIDGNLFGTITTDGLGFAEIEFGDNDGSPAVPGGFPHLVAGQMVSVGPISGSFR